jgi:hypothetical protein
VSSENTEKIEYWCRTQTPGGPWSERAWRRETLSDLLCCALEGGSNYWYDRLCIAEAPPGRTRSEYRQELMKRDGFWHLETPFDGGVLELRDAEENTVYRIGRDEVEGALSVMWHKHRPHWFNLIEDNFDADTGDVFLQLCCFGEVRYG